MSEPNLLIQSAKQRLRQEIYKQLSELSPEQIAAESRDIAAAIRAFLLERARPAGRRLRVAAYHAMSGEADLHEVLTDPVLERVVDFYLPRSVRDGEVLSLHFARWPKGEKARQPEGWLESWYGAIEPPPEAASPGEHFDIMLLPCVACSPAGERLGHGKGYYDRNLAGQKPGTLRYAVCLSPQAVAFPLPVEAHDQILDGRFTVGGLEEARAWPR